MDKKLNPSSVWLLMTVNLLGMCALNVDALLTKLVKFVSPVDFGAACLTSATSATTQFHVPGVVSRSSTKER